MFIRSLPIMLFALLSTPYMAVIVSALLSNVALGSTTFSTEAMDPALQPTTIGPGPKLATAEVPDAPVSNATLAPVSETSTANVTFSEVRDNPNVTLAPVGNNSNANVTLEQEYQQLTLNGTDSSTSLTTNGPVSTSDNASIPFEDQTEAPIETSNSTYSGDKKIICSKTRFDKFYLYKLYTHCLSFPAIEKGKCMEDAKICYAKNKAKFDKDFQDIKKTSDYTEAKIAVSIMRYVSPVLIVIGTVMNFLAFLVLTFTKLREMSSSMYLITLSVTDTLNLTLMLMRDWIKAFWDIDYRESHIVLCKGSSFLAYYVSHISAWLLVAVTVERLVTVYFPLKAKLVCTRKNAGIVILAIVLCFFTLDGYLLWLSGPYMHKNENTGLVKNITCNEFSSPEQEYFRLIIWPWLDMAIAAILPFGILLTCNVLIIVNLTRAARWRKESNTGGSTKQNDSTNSMTAMLLVISFIFVLLTLPVTIYLILTSTITETKSFHEIAKLRLAFAITKQLFFLNCAINFLLYCIAGKRFRGELVNLFCGTKDQSVPGTRMTYASRQSSNSGIALNNSSLKHKTANGGT